MTSLSKEWGGGIFSEWGYVHDVKLTGGNYVHVVKTSGGLCPPVTYIRSYIGHCVHLAKIMGNYVHLYKNE